MAMRRIECQNLKEKIELGVWKHSIVFLIQTISSITSTSLRSEYNTYSILEKDLDDKQTIGESAKLNLNVLLNTLEL
jgi:hypothetical protein